MSTTPTPKLKAMITGGRLLSQIRDDLMDQLVVGQSLLDVEREAQRRIRKAGGRPSFPSVPGYHWATCICVNDAVVHGIPSEYRIESGDIVTVDIGMIFQGYHTDTAWTRLVDDGKEHPEVEKFLAIGQQVLSNAIQQARAGNHVGHISRVIQEGITDNGYSVVRSLVGHGVGKHLHEEPQIPGLLSGKIEKTPLLRTGMTIAIEVIYARGKPAVYTDTTDGWTVRTRDKSLSAVFEHSVAVTDTDPIVLTTSGE